MFNLAKISRIRFELKSQKITFLLSSSVLWIYQVEYRSVAQILNCKTVHCGSLNSSAIYQSVAAQSNAKGGAGRGNLGG